MSSPFRSPDRSDSLHSFEGHHSPAVPSPLVTRRTRTDSTSARALQNPQETGFVKSFCRAKGHGFITRDSVEETIFVHISDIEGEYVPLPGDRVKFRVCPIPPKLEKVQAVHVEIIDFGPEVHKKWDCVEGT
ncbi:CSP [Nesidiocoris tenuis]|uniref:CSP n=1 Tax=Nesidiocoris tenuis TaxID=355587 RepID=A0ABN7AYF6_9HEMI|nr:CSP [Nesidiocoris tenuis]